MRIMMTGATGHSGKWFIERLKKENFQGSLICLVREGRDIRYIENSGLDYQIIWGDASDESSLLKAMQDVDIVLHIAHISISPLITQIARKQKISWVILVHTTGRYSKYKSASSQYVQIEDEILKERDIYPELDITIIRPTMIYGSQRDANMHRLVAYLDKHKFYPIFGEGQNLMQPVHARDLGNAYYDIILNAEKTKNKEYNLAGKEPLEYKDLINITSRCLGRKNTLIPIPIKLSILAAKTYNKIFGKKALITVEQVLRMQEDKAFSYEEAKQDFGYAPMGFEEGIAEEVMEYRHLKKKD